MTAKLPVARQPHVRGQGARALLVSLTALLNDRESPLTCLDPVQGREAAEAKSAGPVAFVSLF